MRHRGKGCLSYVVVTLVTIGLLLAVMPLVFAYVLVREDYVTRHRFFYDILAPDPVYGFVIRPHLDASFSWIGVMESYNTDERGFNNPAYLPDAPIAVIGDSYTASNYVPLEARWPYLLSQMSGVAIYNYGVNGYAPWQYLRVITHQAAEAGHQALLVNFYINDFGETPIYYAESGTNYYALAGWETYENPYNFTLSRFNYVMDRLRPAAPVETTSTEGGTPAAFGLDNMLAQVDGMIVAGADLDLTLVFTLIPSGEHIEEGIPSKEEQLYYDEVCAHIRSADHLCYDMTDDFIAAHQETGASLYNVGEHWNDAGNALAATFIYHFLQANRVLDELRI